MHHLLSIHNIIRLLDARKKDKDRRQWIMLLCVVAPFSVAISCMCTHYVSNEREYVSLFNYINDSMINASERKYAIKTSFITFIFLTLTSRYLSKSDAILDTC